jgi:hypothetical protein
VITQGITLTGLNYKYTLFQVWLVPANAQSGLTKKGVIHVM